MEHCDDKFVDRRDEKLVTHCDDKGHGGFIWQRHGALWWQVSRSIVMNRSWSIVVTKVTEPWDDAGMDHCDDKCYEALWCLESRSIVMTWVMEHCDDKGMDHCDDRGMEHFDEKFMEYFKESCQGALWWHMSWSIAMTMAGSILMSNVMEDCYDKYNGALWWLGLEALWWQGPLRIFMTRL